LQLDLIESGFNPPTLSHGLSGAELTRLPLNALTSNQKSNCNASLVLIGLFARYRLTETPEFIQILKRKDVLSQPTLGILRRHWLSLLLAIGITVSEVGLAYLLTVFVITYSTTILALPRQTILNAVVYAALVEFLTLPRAGWLSDIFGRKALYMTGAFASIVLEFPLFWLLDTKNATIITVTLIVTMTLTHALLFGPKAAFVPELFGTRMRHSGASLGANIAAALSGGFSPLIATALLVWTGATWAISLYVIVLRC
jgi:MFS transporter, MHS family, shikimate and dehydroshikimate transport protein